MIRRNPLVGAEMEDKIEPGWEVPPARSNWWDANGNPATLPGAVLAQFVDGPLGPPNRGPAWDANLTPSDKPDIRKGKDGTAWVDCRSATPPVVVDHHATGASYYRDDTVPVLTYRMIREVLA